MNGPTTLPDATQLDNLNHAQYVAMLESCLPTMKADHSAAVYLLAELRKEGDVRIKRARFMKDAGKITGGLPPFVEIALNLVKANGKG